MDDETINKAMSKLSGWQKSWLIWLYKITIALEKSDRYCPAWGISSWHWRKSTTHGLTNSARASISRTWRRLEQRGLLVRSNSWQGAPDTGRARESADQPHNKTTDIKLTDLGREVAKRLTKQQESGC